MQASPGGLWGIATLKDMIGLLADIPLKNQPGTTYEYSVSIDVAGYLAEVLAGGPFPQTSLQDSGRSRRAHFFNLWN